MSPLTIAPRSKTRTPAPHQAFAVALRKEFGVPFAFFDAASGLSMEPDSGAGANLPITLTSAPDGDPFEPQTIVMRAAEGRPAVRTFALGQYLLQLTLAENGRPSFLAYGVFHGLARTPADTEREVVWLQHWLQTFADRLHLFDQLDAQKVVTDDHAAQAKTAWEALLAIDQTMRRLRLHKDPVRNQGRILETAFSLLGAQTLVCVPPDPQLPVTIQGLSLLAAADCSQLGALFAKCQSPQSGPIICNTVETQPWALSFPNIASLMAFPICEQEAPGWIIAINKNAKHGEPGGTAAFRRSDAALLTPFVALLRLQFGMVSRYQDMKELMVGLARSLTAAIDAKDAYTFGHSERVARIGVELGRTLGIEGDALGDIYLAGLLHDVGKIGVPDAILRKEGELTAAEFDQVKKHVTIGYAILSDLRPIRHLLPGVLHHHERIDGNGYPDGLSGDAIPLLARILAVADAYDAMSTSRPYRPAIAPAEVEARLKQGAGLQWDRPVIEAFFKIRHVIHAIRQRGVGESLGQALDGAMRRGDSSQLV